MQLFHQASGLGTPIASEQQYEEALAAVGELMDELAANEASPIAGVILGDARRTGLSRNTIHKYLRASPGSMAYP